MSDLTVFTCVFGNTDPLHEPLARGDARFVCFTDQSIRSKSWEIVRIPKQDHPTRAARTMKALSHVSVPDSEWSLWMDANFTLAADPEALKAAGDFVNFTHRDRSRITDEVAEIVRLGKAKPWASYRQIAEYHAAGFDTEESPQTVLSCNGVILRRHTEAVKAVNEAWAEEINRHTLRDQMSLDYVCWRLGFQLSKWPGSHDRNPHFRYTHYKRPVNDY